MSRRLVRFEVEVRGAGGFPVDMLRYDGLYPHREIDSARIVASYVESGLGNPIVVLSGYHLRDWSPNRARWKSFGYVVVAVRKFD